MKQGSEHAVPYIRIKEFEYIQMSKCSKTAHSLATPVVPVLGDRPLDGGGLGLPLGPLHLEAGLQVGDLGVAGRDVAVDEPAHELTLGPDSIALIFLGLFFGPLLWAFFRSFFRSLF